MEESYLSKPPATIIQRFIAFVIDFSISFVLVFAFAIDESTTVLILLPVSYFLLKDSIPFLNAQSIGKKMIGIQVVSEKDSVPVKRGYLKSVLRNILPLVPIVNFFDALSIFSVSNRRLGDKLANTKVIKR